MNHSNLSSASEVLLWGAPNSAFSAKLRSFFIKSGIDFDERFPVDPRYNRNIVPKIGYWVLPVTELRDGTLMQDSTETMLHFAQSTDLGARLIPRTPLLRVMAHFLMFVGSDGFLKPGMHYRWSFLEEQRTYLEAAFADWLPSNESTDQKRERLTGIMTLFSGYGPALGITEKTRTAIESSWHQCLDILNEHFSACPYLLGAAPTIADCGLMTMLGPHLSRDPVPGYLMRTRAPMVSRWVERMTRPPSFDGGFPGVDSSDFENDTIPPTLLPFLRYLASDVAPEVIATVSRFNAWIDGELQLSSDRSLGDPKSPGAHPTLGEISYMLRGCEVRRLGFIDTVYQFQKVLELLDGMTHDARSSLQLVLDASSLTKLFGQRPSRNIRYTQFRYYLD